MRGYPRFSDDLQLFLKARFDKAVDVHTRPNKFLHFQALCVDKVAITQGGSIWQFRRASFLAVMTCFIPKPLIFDVSHQLPLIFGSFDVLSSKTSCIARGWRPTLLNYVKHGKLKTFQNKFSKSKLQKHFLHWHNKHTVVGPASDSMQLAVRVWRIF